MEVIIKLERLDDKERTVDVIKAVRRVTGLGLRQSKELVINAPSYFKIGHDVLDEEAKELFEEAGAVVSIGVYIPFPPLT